MMAGMSSLDGLSSVATSAFENLVELTLCRGRRPQLAYGIPVFSKKCSKAPIPIERHGVGMYVSTCVCPCVCTYVGM